MGGGGFTAFHASTAAHIIDGGNIVNVCPKCRMVTERSCGFSATAMATESRAVFTSDGESWNCVLSPNQEGYCWRTKVNHIEKTIDCNQAQDVPGTPQTRAGGSIAC